MQSDKTKCKKRVRQNMTKEELFDLRDHGEVTKVQFKERIIDTYDVACELVAFSNYHGGQLVQGYRVGEKRCR